MIEGTLSHCLLHQRSFGNLDILFITAKTWQFNKNVICGQNDPNQTRAVIHCIYFKGLALGVSLLAAKKQSH